MRSIAFTFDAPVFEQLHIRRPPPKRNAHCERTREHGWILDLRFVFERVFRRQPKSLDNSCGTRALGSFRSFPAAQLH
jgi:hypothetical protein